MYLNVFVYDTISDDPNVIATMVAVSAVAATLATLLVGALSDRVGRRRVFIAVGYVLWGSRPRRSASSARGGHRSGPRCECRGGSSGRGRRARRSHVVVRLGANDAAFQAWVTDSTQPENRGRVESVLAVMPLLSMLVVFGAFDGMTRAGQWREFFVLVGAIIVVVGLVSWFLVRDRELVVRQEDGYLRSMVHGLRPSAVRENPACTSRCRRG
ncbi:MFS transporter [Oerskovia sp. M15]